MPEILTELTSDFSAGMVDDASYTRFPQNAVALALNARIEEDGTVRRRPGSIQTHASALNGGETVYGAHSFTTAAGTEQIIAFVGDTAYMSDDRGASWTQIATSLREDYYDFAIMRVGSTNYLYAANGDSVVKQWDGSSMTDLSNAPTGGVKFVEVFNGRLWFGGHSGVILQASKINDPTTVATPDGLLVTILAHGAHTITGLHQIGPHLLVFDDDSTSYIDGFGEQTLVIATGATGFSRSVGCVAFRTIQSVGENAACWLSKRGIEYYTPGSSIVRLATTVDRFMRNIDLQQLKDNPGRPTAVYDPIEEHYYIALSTTGVNNNRVLAVNLRQRGSQQFGAPAVDAPQPSSGGILFLPGADGYLTTGAGGFELKADDQGYATLVTEGEGGSVTVEDAEGYLDTSTNDTLPATLFVAPTSSRSSAVYSGGYDGFIRNHEEDGKDLDDVASDDTGGSVIGMRIVSRPFLFRRPRNPKRVRFVEIATINDDQATIQLGVRAGGSLTELRSVTIPGKGLNQHTRRKVMVHAVGDAPQVDLYTEDDVRVALIGVGAEVMEERIG